MIWACRDAPAIPFIRVPDANEGTIRATDIGALGIIVPMVDSEKMADAVRYAKYPLQGPAVRAEDNGDYGGLIIDNPGMTMCL